MATCDYLLQEDGFKIGLEDGTGFLLLEEADCAGVVGEAGIGGMGRNPALYDDEDEALALTTAVLLLDR